MRVRDPWRGAKSPTSTTTSRREHGQGRRVTELVLYVSISALGISVDVDPLLVAEVVLADSVAARFRNVPDLMTD